MNEQIKEEPESTAQLWLGRLLQEEDRMRALARKAWKSHPGTRNAEKYEDVRQTALLTAWRFIIRSIEEGRQRSNLELAEQLAKAGDPDTDQGDDSKLSATQIELWNSIEQHDELKFQRIMKNVIYNQIEFKGTDLVDRETNRSIQTLSLDPDAVGINPLRRNEKSAPIEYTEPDAKSAQKQHPLIDPDQSFPDTREEIEERENDQNVGYRLKESWVKFLWGIHDQKASPAHKRRLKACIEFERLAFVDSGEIRINMKIRKPEDDNPFLYHAILGDTHGVRPKLAELYNISLRSLEGELRLMRDEYWPAWVATVIEEREADVHG